MQPHSLSSNKYINAYYQLTNIIYIITISQNMTQIIFPFIIYRGLFKILYIFIKSSKLRESHKLTKLKIENTKHLAVHQCYKFLPGCNRPISGFI